MPQKKTIKGILSVRYKPTNNANGNTTHISFNTSTKDLGRLAMTPNLYCRAEDTSAQTHDNDAATKMIR